MNQTLNEISAEFEKVKTELRTKAEAAINVAFKECFDNHPELTCISFTAFTPYFNDGEPCEYGVHSFHVSNAKDIDSVSPYGELDGDDSEEFIKSSWNDKENVYADVWAIEKFAGSNLGEELFEHAFGDGVFVRVTRDGDIIIGEHDHD